MTADEWIKLLGVLTGGTALFGGLWQYVVAQRWKRAEFVVTQVKEFEAKSAVRYAMMMLDWNDCQIESRPEEKTPSKRYEHVDNDIVQEALRLDTEKDQWSDLEEVVLDCFSQFFDGLERFGHFLESGLVKPDDLYPYLRYWVDTIGDESGRRKPAAFVHTVWRHIHHYRYRGVQYLFMAFGYDIAKREVGSA